MPAASYFIGKGIQVLYSMLLQLILLMTCGKLFFKLELPTQSDRWLTFLWLVALGTATATILGIAFSAIPKSGRGASAVVSPVVIILQFFSGVFFVFTQLPQWMQHVAAIFPLKWLTQGMRYVFLPDSFASHEAAKSWELNKILLNLVTWLVVGSFFAAKTFKWSSEK
jgi:ABC-2 type transport system permease protein